LHEVKDITYQTITKAGMTHLKAVSVIGYKDSGKTRVVEALVGELTGRGYTVGTLKHTAEDVPLDTPGKDTMRHREAGSVATAILHGRSAALFIDRYLTVHEAIAKLGPLDYVVVEGFKSLDISAKVIAPREASEIEGLSNGLEIAIVDLIGEEIREGGGVPVIPIDEPGRLADVVEERAFPLLPGLDCKGCGYPDCRSMGVALLAGESTIDGCVGYRPSFSLRVDDAEIPLGPFVQDMVRNTVLGMVRSLKGVERPSKVELRFEEGKDDS
jgi:molybdopterin-guanine dinucleotide biosynthesis protein B